MYARKWPLPLCMYSLIAPYSCTVTSTVEPSSPVQQDRYLVNKFFLVLIAQAKYQVQKILWWCWIAWRKTSVPNLLTQFSQFSNDWKRAFWACFLENWVYKFGHWRTILRFLAENNVPWFAELVERWRQSRLTFWSWSCFPAQHLNVTSWF